ncbi:trimeric LpxA-like protein [Didymella exigua CBS 183.55]|uniref:Dynactin subunit 6 n=1 Tax=Didymella exigua CBS 183.55 TaxID=1150837 RepID=A0A6A5S1P6_9PLEO|nr:trimeric LpxA-like protein [Didymella exigua CBS 183.55]KAF1931447.1 trimeric LpxA-like protein [Didymella exigua CBS 183.55]
MSSRDPRRTSTVHASKRTSLLPRPSSIAIDPTALVAQHAQLTGSFPITIGPGAVLHPHARVNSAGCVVVLGEGVVLFERARVGVEGELGRSAGEDVVLGRNVVVETGAVVEGREVGEGSVVEVGAVVGRGAVVGKYCTVSAASVVPPYTTLPDFTVVFSGSQKRVDKTLQQRPDILEQKMAVHQKQLDMFRRLIANNIAKWTG